MKEHPTSVDKALVCNSRNKVMKSHHVIGNTHHHYHHHHHHLLILFAPGGTVPHLDFKPQKIGPPISCVAYSMLMLLRNTHVLTPHCSMTVDDNSSKQKQLLLLHMDTVPFPVQGLCYWWLKLLQFGSCLVVHGRWCACSDSWYDNSSFTVVTGVGRKARFETREADYMSSIEKHPSCAFGSESNCHLNSIFFYIISYKYWLRFGANSATLDPDEQWNNLVLFLKQLKIGMCNSVEEQACAKNTEKHLWCDDLKLWLCLQICECAICQK